MLRSVEVTGFRGLKHLTVEGLGRVNLIVGKNDCGKTTLLEALAIASEPSEAAQIAMAQQARRGLRIPPTDFENYWRPLFYSSDADRGFEVKGTTEAGVHSVTVQRAALPAESINANPSVGLPMWTLSLTTRMPQRPSTNVTVSGFLNQVVFPASTAKSKGLWSALGQPDDGNDLAMFSTLKQTVGDGGVKRLLSHIEPSLDAIDILAPAGLASIYVRVSPGVPMLPLKAMGAGFQHCFDIALSLGTADIHFVIFDEIDNGLHHSLLGPVWTLLAKASRETGTQVHVTTHSEECVAAAARVFQELKDDGLRVIRVDRGKEGSRASVYDANLAAVAMDEGVELRG